MGTVDPYWLGPIRDRVRRALAEYRGQRYLRRGEILELVDLADTGTERRRLTEVLRRMRDAGELVSIGERAGTRWHRAVSR